MVAPRKKDYSDIAPDVIRDYTETRNILKVARKYRISPVTARRILDENNVSPGATGVHNSKRKKEPFDPDSCHFCHKYSRVTTVSGFCLKHRRTVSGYSIEACFT